MKKKTCGQTLRDMRPIKTYTCEHCGKIFTASDARARFCSGSCCSAARRARLKREVNEGTKK